MALKMVNTSEAGNEVTTFRAATRIELTFIQADSCCHQITLTKKIYEPTEKR